MKILLIAIGVVFLIWIVSLLIQGRERKLREMRIKKRLEEKKKEEEKNQTPFKH